MTVAVTVAMGAVGIVGTRPMDLHLYQKDGKPRGQGAVRTQEHPVWPACPPGLASPPHTPTTTGPDRTP